MADVGPIRFLTPDSLTPDSRPDSVPDTRLINFLAERSNELLPEDRDREAAERVLPRLLPPPERTPIASADKQGRLSHEEGAAAKNFPEMLDGGLARGYPASRSS